MFVALSLNFKADFACDIYKSKETVVKPYVYIYLYFLHIDDYKNKEDRRGNVDCIFGSV